MAKDIDQIGLKLPGRKKPGKGAFSVKSGDLGEWVENLPVGNAGETTKMVFGTLQEVNRQDIPWKDRYRFLEQLRSTVSFIHLSLAKRFIGMSFPLPPRVHRVARLAQALSSEMAMGYKIAIEDMLGSSFFNRDKKALMIMIHRAIHYLSRLLLTNYQTYSPHPGDVWFEIHMLYLHAEHKGVHMVQVQDRETPQLPESSIARIYKQILLLALASPYRLRQGEAENVYQALGRWASHVHVIAYDDPGARDALFVIHMDSDQPPDYLSFDNRDCDSELCRLVDTSRLSRVLGDELVFTKQRSDSGRLEGHNISPDLLGRLILAWGLAPKRQFTRSYKEAGIEVVIGITALHQALAADLGDEVMSTHLSKYQVRSVKTTNRATTDDIWNIFSTEELSDAVRDEFGSAPSIKLDVITHRWQIKNESAGGYRLATQYDSSAKVHVGELLGLKPKNISKWEIGAVRWIRQIDDIELELGIQILSPEARPVMVKAWSQRNSKIDFQRALLLPELRAVNKPASLLTPIRLYQPGKEILMHVPGKDVSITLGKIKQDSGSFVQFAFRNTKDHIDHLHHDSVRVDDEFEELWSEL